MARGKKLSDAEAKLKKKEYDRKRREKMKSNPEVLAKLREKERISYLKKKQKGQIKSVTAMSSRERRLKRKNWKKNSQSYRHRKAQVRKNLTSLLNKVSPSSSRLAADPVLQNNNKRESMIAVLRRKQLRKRRAIQYAKIAKLQKELKEQIRQKEKYKKRSQRRNKKVLSSPEAKVSALLKNVQGVTVTPFRGTQKIRQFVFASDILEFRSLSCCQCIGECSHFHLGYYLSSKTPHVEKRLGKVQTRSCGRQSANNFFNDNDSQIDESYDIGDFVLIKWNDAIYPGKITSVSDDAAVVDCMERVIKSWRWPTPKDEALYPWTDVVQKIEPPKFIRKGYFSVKEINQLKL
ncbi:calponin homology domain-containing protein DDB_G0272472-like [Battus philenor]|uniref:calponin homology domain-containing protein DDB_G0272472-like n=1 Tax=Battus philenor TaxID=42288 RepID=UPI0035CECF69